MFVSIITAARNAETTIGKCIDSILKQRVTFPFEHIIVEDGSTDNTVDLIKGYNKNFLNKIRLITGTSRGPARRGADAVPGGMGRIRTGRGIVPWRNIRGGWF